MILKAPVYLGLKWHSLFELPLKASASKTHIITRVPHATEQVTQPEIEHLDWSGLTSIITCIIVPTEINQSEKFFSQD